MPGSNLTPKELARPAPYAPLAAIFDNLQDGRLLALLWQQRWGGRPGHPIRPLWRAYVSSFVLNLDSTNSLIRRLQADQALRRLCGFGPALPHRTTFNRFIARLSYHSDLVEACLVSATHKLRALLPDLGEQVAVDSTTVRTHANPNRKRRADREAGWTVKHSARAKEDGKEWHYGYKAHMVADANYGIPLGVAVTPANRNDSPELPGLMDRMRTLLPWCTPQAAIADKGYDALSNHRHLHQQGIVPVIHIRRPAGIKRHAGIYADEGAPTCIGDVPMAYVRSDPEKGHLYRCVGCDLSVKRPGVHNCLDEVWEAPETNLRTVVVLPRETPEWQALYAKRQSIERTFKSLKQSRRLERHHVRGRRAVTLHILMAVLVYQVTALVTVMGGAPERMRWMVAQVA